MSTIPVVVPAAGIGSRMQADRPKQYLTLNGKTVLEHTLERLQSHPLIGQIYVAVSAQDRYISVLGLDKHNDITLVDGGKERADSVLAGLTAINDSEWVLVHDAARPCLTHGDIDKLLASMRTGVGAILATKVRDTMKRSDSQNHIQGTVERANLWHALTPQLLPFQALLMALRTGLASGHQITDEASAMELAGHKVGIVEGRSDNIKITQPLDLALAEFYLQAQQEFA